MYSLRRICCFTKKCHGISNSQYIQVQMINMRAWQAHEYGTPDVLELNAMLSVPAVRRPADVLVKVSASSVNPLDVMMLKGYGAAVVQNMRRVYDCTLNPKVFPITLGRDFSGTVVSTGSCVKNFKPGDEVCGIVGPEQQGSHADYVTAPSYCISRKPATLSHVGAASMPYAALTAWSALCTFGNLSANSAYGKRVVVFGGSGGIGTIAIQLLKAWGAEVTATCSTDAVEMVQNLGADHVIDYQTEDVRSRLKNMPQFDFILDTVGGKNKSCLDVLKKWRNCKYVTVVSPTLKNADNYGFIFGTTVSACEAFADTAMSLKDGRSLRWAYVVPNGCALKTICEMANNKEIAPVVEKVFKFEELPEAYKKVLDGHARGKTVINHLSTTEGSERESSPEKHDNMSKPSEVSK